MLVTNENQITFENYYPDGNTHWQDIFFNTQCIGALVQVHSGLLQPIKERYQMLVNESEIEKNVFDGWYESEDKGKVFGYFHTLENFITYYNSLLTI